MGYEPHALIPFGPLSHAGFYSTLLLEPISEVPLIPRTPVIVRFGHDERSLLIEGYGEKDKLSHHPSIDGDGDILGGVGGDGGVVQSNNSAKLVEEWATRIAGVDRGIVNYDLIMS